MRRRCCWSTRSAGTSSPRVFRAHGTATIAERSLSTSAARACASRCISQLSTKGSARTRLLSSKHLQSVRIDGAVDSPPPLIRPGRLPSSNGMFKEIYLWRGMRDIVTSASRAGDVTGFERFKQRGGSLLAPCSASHDEKVALRYAAAPGNRQHCALPPLRMCSLTTTVVSSPTAAPGLSFNWCLRAACDVVCIGMP